MREICKSGSEGGAGQTNVPFLPLSRDHARKARHLKFRLQLARPRQAPSKFGPSSATNSARLPPLAHGSQLIFEWPWLCWQNGDQPVSLRCARRWKDVRMSDGRDASLQGSHFCGEAATALRAGIFGKLGEPSRTSLCAQELLISRI